MRNVGKWTENRWNRIYFPFCSPVLGGIGSRFAPQPFISCLMQRSETRGVLDMEMIESQCNWPRTILLTDYIPEFGSWVYPRMDLTYLRSNCYLLLVRSTVHIAFFEVLTTSRGRNMAYCNFLWNTGSNTVHRLLRHWYHWQLDSTKLH